MKEENFTAKTIFAIELFSSESDADIDKRNRKRKIQPVGLSETKQKHSKSKSEFKGMTFLWTDSGLARPTKYEGFIYCGLGDI